MASSHASKPAIYAALAGNLAVAVTKFGAAAWTGSSSMLSEAVHSLVDTLNEVLLLYGLHRSAQRPDAEHPLGHGRELYFWSFVVALLVFALGAGVSIYEGVVHLRDPEPIQSPMVAYAVLALSLVFESISWAVAYRQFRASNPDRGVLSAIRRSKDPATFTVLLEDTAAVIGLGIALLATYAAHELGRPEFDAIGSLAIGGLLGVTALILARETKGLLIGEPADRAISDLILRVARDQRGVASANGVITTHLAPDQITASISIEFDDDLRTPDIERVVDAIEKQVRGAAPAVTMLFVKPQTARGYATARARRFGVEEPPVFETASQTREA
ncbi:cation diffusion facilitator family transporter [Alsobacter sp. KACC 23698]|uniref:Cation diffusion facilitator family transporter n=1 Tax=Alsobacter sp. KACC 23698 TaxID=3149229 RepID=A0AAU7JL42_9HYPH